MLLLSFICVAFYAYRRGSHDEEERLPDSHSVISVLHMQDKVVAYGFCSFLEYLIRPLTHKQKQNRTLQFLPTSGLSLEIVVFSLLM